MILLADKKLFSRLLIIGQSRKIDLREILSYSLGTVSYPLASMDGSLAKTNKSALMDLLEAKGVGNRTRIIYLVKVSTALGNGVCLALIGIHTFSGCDSTSAFHGKGKRKTFSVACEKEEYLSAFTHLGSSFEFDQSTFDVLSKYVCHLYGQSSAENVNDARYRAFCMASSAFPEL